MNRTEAIAELERLREWERGKVIAGISDGERYRRARTIAALTYAIDEMHRMAGLEK